MGMIYLIRTKESKEWGDYSLIKWDDHRPGKERIGMVCCFDPDDESSVKNNGFKSREQAEDFINSGLYTSVTADEFISWVEFLKDKIRSFSKDDPETANIILEEIKLRFKERAKV